MVTLLAVAALAVLVIRLPMQLDPAMSPPLDPGKAFDDIDVLYLETDVDSLIHVRSTMDAQRARQRLIDYIWKGQGFPRAARALRELLDPRQLGHVKAERLERLTIEMDQGYTSVAYLAHPPRPNGRLMIYHQGHSSSWTENGGDTAVAFFSRRGYTVLIFMMPLFGENTGPIAFRGTTHAHNAMATTTSPTLNPIKFFLEPIATALNTLENDHAYHDIGMIGISGGGWTTHLYAAIDPRVRQSFAVAGSLPWYLRAGAFHGPRDKGDWEQGFTRDLKNLTYLDMYILAGEGKGRHHLQILNKYDACCFAGIRHRTYEPSVQAAMRGIDHGAFTIFLDDSHHDHAISMHALETAVTPLLAGAERAREPERIYAEENPTD